MIENICELFIDKMQGNLFMENVKDVMIEIGIINCVLMNYLL